MTLGRLGGAVQPLTRDELLDLYRKTPVTDLIMTGRAFGVSEPVIRAMARSGELEAAGVRVLRFGAQYRVPVSDIMTVLGIDPDPPSAPQWVRRDATPVQEPRNTTLPIEFRRPA